MHHTQRFRFVCLVLGVLLLGTHVAQAAASVPTLLRVAGSSVGERGASDGVGDAARFNYPLSVALNASATFALVADAQNSTIRRFDLASGAVTTLAGTAAARGANDGSGAAARFAYPSGVALSPGGTFALVADTDNHTIRRLDLASGAVTTLAGSAGSTGSADGTGNAARFNAPTALAFSPDGNVAFVVDTENNAIRRITIVSGAVTTVAGGVRGNADGTGPAARFAAPHGIAISPGGLFALIADTDNQTIRRLDLASGTVTTIAGTVNSAGIADGIGIAASFNFPRGITFSDTSTALVADFSSSTIRRIDLLTGTVTTLFGAATQPGATDGAGARLNYPAGIASAGGSTLIADTYNHTLRRVGSVAVQERVWLPMVAR